MQIDEVSFFPEEIIFSNKNNKEEDLNYPLFYVINGNVILVKQIINQENII